MGAAELHDDGECSHEQRQRDILQDLLTVGHHQNQERGDVEHQRELDDDEGGNLAEHLRRGHSFCSHLVSQRGGRQTNGAEAHGHGVGNQTDHSREHRFET